ncbi:ATP-binding protein [Streptomyces mobaraensis]|uniref:ATP-binding protein n=1 Tax=Streptomyces mobaraensis TaxID=35621 RepID=UPI0013DEE038|nr:ATP-binding protein [Streptomyces mobaraensis]
MQPLPESLRRARRAARGVVERWHPTESDLVDRAELVVGELLANSYLHAGPTADGAIGLALTGTSTGVLVVVEDGANTSGSPDIREPCETGRGLALVDSASNSWSWHTNRAGGRTTWAFVSRTGFGAPA